MDWRRLEVNGGVVVDGEQAKSFKLRLPAIKAGYADAQIDDYGRHARRHFSWQPGLELTLRARFSHPDGLLRGTAGFGFWNAPFGDPTFAWPALPQATWFFYASTPSDLPLAPSGPGQGWFAATLDATTWRAMALAPFAPAVLLLNQARRLRQRIWPAVQKQLAISYAQLAHDMTAWHDYRLSWQQKGCSFYVDGAAILQTAHSPRGPLGFVCWLDNQYMVTTAHGRFAWGTLATESEQWLEIEGLTIRRRGEAGHEDTAR